MPCRTGGLRPTTRRRDVGRFFSHDVDMQTAPPMSSDLVRPKKRRGRVLGTALLVVSISLAGAAAAVRSQHRTDPPAVRIDPQTVAGLTLEWTADTGPGPTSPTVSGDNVFVGNGTSLTAYPTTCLRRKDSCAPDWTDPVTDGPLSTPVLQSGVVYAASAGGSLYVFPSRCDLPSCPPRWIGRAGKGSLSVPRVNSDYVYAASNRLFAFPAQCGTAGEDCPPSWTAKLPGPAASGPPGLGGGLVLVATRGERGGISAFPAACSARCQPVWVGSTGGPATGVVVSGQTAFTIARGRLFAFPLSCHETCEPSWTAPFVQASPLFEPGASGRPAVGADRIFVGDMEGHLWMFPLTCATDTCVALGRVAIGGAPLTTPVLADGVVFVVSSAGLVTAIKDACRIGTQNCAPRWSNVLSASATSTPSASATALFVGDDLGTLYAYALHRTR
jgi:outer membrane protein assembly factor BamB